MVLVSYSEKILNARAALELGAGRSSLLDHPQAIFAHPPYGNRPPPAPEGQNRAIFFPLLR
jgi:hypothetical protein